MDGETERGAAHLERHGWTRRFTTVGPRLTECVAAYEQLGYEVWLEPADAPDGDMRTPACQSCAITALARTIYTRPRQPISQSTDFARA